MHSKAHEACCGAVYVARHLQEGRDACTRRHVWMDGDLTLGPAAAPGLAWWGISGLMQLSCRSGSHVISRAGSLVLLIITAWQQVWIKIELMEFLSLHTKENISLQYDKYSSANNAF